MSISLFDANFYRAVNSDLAGYSDAQAQAHFQRWGIDEGRRFSPYVNLNFYRSTNSDLANFSNRQLLDHLQTYGVQEERRFSEFVDLNFYRSTNTDLRAFRGEQLFEHLRLWGVNEGRRSTPFVDLGVYRSRNADLSSLSLQQALIHLQVFGLNEGRQFSTAFDVNYYRNLNPDLARIGFNNLQLLQHFEVYGADEGRISAIGFNGKVYLANNADLRAAGFGHRQAFQHFVVYGHGEGRPGSDYAGNTLATARSGATTPLDFVGAGDTDDFYRFNISSASTFGASLTGVSANVSLRLLSSGGGEIQATGSGNLNSATIGQSLDPGTYYLQVSLPAATQGTNYSLSSSIVPQLPGLDLLGTSFDVVQEPLNAGDGFDVNFQVYNAPINGRSVTARAFRIGFYLSPDSTITTGDRLLGFYDVSSIAAGGFLSQSARLTLPNPTDTVWSSNQTYFIGMVVDSLGAVTEGNETNNASRGPQSDFDDVAITVSRPVVTIAATDASAAEPNNPGQFTLARTGSTASALTVNYSVSGTATNGSDYSSIANSITIAAGQSTAIIPITVLDDLLIEGNETVVLTLNSASAYSLGSGSSLATVTIVDNDVLPTVTIAATDAAAAEPNNPGQFTLTRTGSTASALTVSYSVGGTATNGSDYSSISNSITIAAGQSTAILPITVLDDGLIEGNETVVLSLTSTSTYSLGSGTLATVTIADNDPLDGAGNTIATAFDLGVLTDSRTLRDWVGSTDTNDYYRFNLTAGSNFSLSLDGLSANANVSLLSSSGAVLRSSAQGGTSPESIVTFLDPGTYYVRVFPFSGDTSYTLNLTAVPLPRVTIVATDSSAGEPNNPGQFTITRTGSTAALTVNYTINGTATNGVDYTFLGRSATIAAGQTSVVVPITVLDDSLSEGDETVTLSLNFSSAYSLGSSSTGTVTIVDNDLTDLAASFFDVTAASLGAAQSFTVNFRLQNLGNVNAPGFYTGLYLSRDRTITSSDYFFSSYYLSGLAANSTSNLITGTFQLPDASDPFWSGSKTYYIGLIVDNYGWVSESNETNNANQGLAIDYDSLAVSVVNTLPDLRATFFDAPEPLTAGSTTTINFRIQNAGNANSGRFGIGFYLSNDSTITGSDRAIGEYHFDDLAANTTSDLLSLTLNLPIAGDVFWSGSKTYYFGLSIDGRNLVRESDETNNSNRGNGLDWDDVPITVNSAVLTDPIVATGVASSDPAINSLLNPNRTYWNTSANGGIITYSFYKSASGPYTGLERVSEVSDQVKIHVRQFLGLIESYINIRFVEVADAVDRSGVLRYMLSDGPDYAYAYYPGLGVGGDIHLSEDSSSSFSQSYGSYGYMAMIHETLHALGLKHPGNYGLSAGPFLSGGEDNATNTVMSYNSDGGGAISPMPYDIRALQYLYGVKPARATNTTYNFRSPTGYRVDSQFFGSTPTPLRQTLWDTGGVDTLDFSNVSTLDDYYFDLRQGGILTTQSAYNAIRYTALGEGGSYSTSALGTAIAFNTTIENLINSRSNDIIIANSANNVFKGYALGTFTGNDTIEQSSSADVLELAGYSLAGLTATMSGTDLTIGLGANGTVRIKDYYGRNGSMKIWVNGTYYTYRAIGGWQVTAAPARSPRGSAPAAPPGLTATIPTGTNLPDAPLRADL